MKRSRRVIALNMFWSLLSLCINYLMNFLITPYVTNNIGVEAFGFVALANIIYQLCGYSGGQAERHLPDGSSRWRTIRKSWRRPTAIFLQRFLADLILACVLLAGGTVAIVRLDPDAADSAGADGQM